MTGPDEDDRPGKWGYTPGDVVLTQCASCTRFVNGTFAGVCRAFPAGIPAEVIENRFDHRKPHPDEIEPARFEARGDVPAATLDALYRALDALAD